MSLKYSADWGNEVVHLANLDAASREQDKRLINLIEMAECTQDKKVVRTLMQSLAFYNANIDSTFEGVLSTIDYPLFYNVLFELIPELLQKEYGYYIINFLISNEDHEDTKEEWETIEAIANKHLNKQDLEGILAAYQEQAEIKYSSYPEDYPYDIFEKIFRKLLKDKVEDND